MNAYTFEYPGDIRKATFVIIADSTDAATEIAKDEIRKTFDMCADDGKVHGKKQAKTWADEAISRLVLTAMAVADKPCVVIHDEGFDG